MGDKTDFENETVSQVSERAARRAIEAISRVGTLNRDVEDLKAENAALRARLDDLEADKTVNEARLTELQNDFRDMLHAISL